MTKLAVLGSPIAHSLSPVLHRSAYRVLGLDWEYESIELQSSGLVGFIDSRGAEWRGLSLTMPLKQEVMTLLDVTDPLAELTGVANTVLFHQEKGDWSLRGFNTDVLGIVEAFRGAGVSELGTVRMLGAGATAASALVAVARLGSRRVTVSARSSQKLSALIDLGERLGIDVQASHSDDSDDALVPDAVISTLPGGAAHPYRFNASTRGSAVLFDVAYDPWPSPLAAHWLEVGGRVIPGIEMLVNQALLQVRIFVDGSADHVLPFEADVRAAMRASVGL